MYVMQGHLLMCMMQYHDVMTLSPPPPYRPLLYRMLTYFTQLQKSKATKVSSDMAMSSTNTTQSVLKTNCVIEKPTFPDT